MITKEQILEQYRQAAEKEMVGDRYPDAEEIKAIKIEAQKRYVQEYKTNSDLGAGVTSFNEYGEIVRTMAPLDFDKIPYGMNLGADTYRFDLKKLAPEEWPTITPLGFMNVCAGMKDEDATKEDTGAAEDLLIETIRQGVNTEAIKKRVFAMRDALDRDAKESGVRSNQLLANIGHVFSVISQYETESPYYDLKTTLQRIEACKKIKQEAESKRDSEKVGNCEKKLQALEDEMQDFIETCPDKGLDSEIAQEFIDAWKSNFMRIQNANRVAIKQSDTKTTNVEPVSDSDIKKVKERNPGDFGKQETKAEEQERIRQEVKRTKQEQNSYVDEYGVVRHRENEKTNTKYQAQGYARGR
ncbi:MAG: hypothetical protein IJS68_01800 [Clostridia bacterium]|nr:hypothetical protein [Clostridia bacterium]